MKENYVAVSLGKIDTGETDRLYTFYTREKGLLRIGAKGVRKPTARLAAHVEDFVFAHITIAQNYGPGTLVGAVSENGFTHVRSDFATLQNVMRARDVFVQVVRGSQQDEALFDLLVAFLQSTEDLLMRDDTRSSSFLADAFLWKCFALLGYRFILGKCAGCGGALTPERCAFDAHVGGVLCASCTRTHAQCITLDASTITFLRLAARHDMQQLYKVRVTPRVETQLKLLMQSVATWIMR